MFGPLSPKTWRAAPRRLACCAAAAGALSLAPAAPQAQTSQEVELREERRYERLRQLREQQRVRDQEMQRRSAARDVMRRNAPPRVEAFPGALRSHLTREQRRALEPAPELRNSFAALLAQPATGMVRLLPNAGCDDIKTINAAEACRDAPPIVGGGSFYSFRRRTHEGGAWSDVQLRDGALRTNFTDTVIGMLAKLGDVPLEQVSTSHPLVASVAAFTFAPEAARLGEQHDRIRAGFRVAGSRVAASLPALADTTYVLRSVALRRGDIFDSEFRRVDILVAFRVVSQEPDGALTILWRELARQKSPKLILEKSRSKT